MKRENWNESNIPDQSGKIFIVTGSTSGLGKETARVLSYSHNDCGIFFEKGL